MRILNHKETKHLSRPLPSKETELVIKNLQTKKIPGPDGFTGEFYQTFKEELKPILLKFFQKVEEEGTFYEASVTLIPSQKYYKKKTADQYP